MIPKELASLIAQLELTARKHISGPLLGDWRSVYKGTGAEFHQLRDYIEGDDIRSIDWKASARSNKMLVRQYLEDRNRTVYIVLDISASTFYGSSDHSKSDAMRQLAALLAFVALHSKDSVGLILFTDEIEKVIAPRASRAHVLSLIQTIYTYKPKNTKTDIAVPLDYIMHIKGQKSLICFISDFAASLDSLENKNLLKTINRSHDVLAFRCLDRCETDFPSIGMLTVEDKETGQKMEIPQSGALNKSLRAFNNHQKDMLAAARIDCLDIMIQKPYTKELVQFLRTRA